MVAYIVPLSNGVLDGLCFWLRIRDAATLSRNRIQQDKLFMYTAKTGTPVYCPLPPFVIDALNAIPESTYFFWTGNSTPKTVAGVWQESLKRLFILAGVPDGHAHRFRDTFLWHCFLLAFQLNAPRFC